MTWTQSQRQVFGSVRGVTWFHRFSLQRFCFLHVHGKTVHFLNIQEVLIGIRSGRIGNLAFPRHNYRIHCRRQ